MPALASLLHMAYGIRLRQADKHQRFFEVVVSLLWELHFIFVCPIILPIPCLGHIVSHHPHVWLTLVPPPLTGKGECLYVCKLLL